jgi:hypothetical protein
MDLSEFTQLIQRTPHVSLLPLWHGTSASALESIFTTGFANLSLTDDGFFGKGLYIIPLPLSHSLIFLFSLVLFCFVFFCFIFVFLFCFVFVFGFGFGFVFVLLCLFCFVLSCFLFCFVLFFVFCFVFCFVLFCFVNLIFDLIFTQHSRCRICTQSLQQRNTSYQLGCSVFSLSSDPSRSEKPHCKGKFPKLRCSFHSCLFFQSSKCNHLQCLQVWRTTSIH